MRPYKEIRAGVFYAPLLLSNLDADFVEKMFPYEVGIEWECAVKSSHKDVDEELIILMQQNYIIEYSITLEETSVRFPKGLKGLQGLYLFCDILRRHYFFNNRSGIHIHVDFRGKRFGLFLLSTIAKQKWILKSLDKWEYKGEWNQRKIGITKKNWVRYPTCYNTVEFRIFDMSFFYEEIVKYVLNVQNISKRLKKNIGEIFNKNIH